MNDGGTYNMYGKDRCMCSCYGIQKNYLILPSLKKTFVLGLLILHTNPKVTWEPSQPHLTLLAQSFNPNYICFILLT